MKIALVVNFDFYVTLIDISVEISLALCLLTWYFAVLLFRA